MDSFATSAASDAVASLRTTVVRRAALLASSLCRLRSFFLRADEGVHAAMELLADDNRFRGRHVRTDPAAAAVPPPLGPCGGAAAAAAAAAHTAMAGLADASR